MGLATRLAALYEFGVLFVAWAFVHHFLFSGHGADHGELMWLYLSALIALFIPGPGRFSLDHLLSKRVVLNADAQEKPLYSTKPQEYAART